MSQNNDIPDYLDQDYKHTEEDFLSIQGNNIENYIDVSDLEFPIHLETKKGSCWERIEETGKFYTISRQLFYLFGSTTVRQETYKGEDKEELEVEEQYSLIFGNLSRRQSISSLHFYTNQRAKNAYKVISEEYFQEKLKLISQDFEDFINKSYPNLKQKKNVNNRTERQEQENNGTPF